MRINSSKKIRSKVKKAAKIYNNLDVLLLAILPILSFAVSLGIHANFLISTFLFFGLPSIYLSIRNQRIILKTSIFTLLFSIPMTFIFDYLMVRDNAWYIVDSVFPFRLFGVVVLEQFIWSFLWVYFLISLYEIFFDRRIKFQKDRLISRSMLMFALLMGFIVFGMIGVILKNASIVVIPYAYVFLGLSVGVIPIIIFLFHFPHLFTRFIKITTYFIFLSILIEYTGLKLHHWIFSGYHYLLRINFFGYSIPIEELLFYFLLSTPGVLTYYEYFDDDKK